MTRRTRLGAWLSLGVLALTSGPATGQDAATSQEALPDSAALAPALGVQVPDPASSLAEAGPIDPAERFQTGNSLYQAGDFSGALEAYEQIIEAGYDSGDLQYNLGNAHFKLGQLGPAILAYERARVSLPGDENLLANLELARSLTPDQITPLPGFWLTRAWDWWVDLLPRAMLFTVVALGYLAAMALVAWRVVRPARSRAALTAAGWVAGITFLFAINLSIREFGLGRAEFGVVMATETPVQSAPADDPGLQLFSIHEGTRVRIDRSSEGWLEIVLDDGQVGWLRAETVERI